MVAELSTEEIDMLGTSKCGSCGGFTFKIQEQSPQGSRFKFYFMQCAACNVPVGAVDFYNIGDLVTDQKDMLLRIGQDVSNLIQSMESMRHQLALVAAKNRREK